MLTDIVRRMTVHTNLIPWDPTHAEAVVRVAEQDDRVDEVGGSAGDEIGGIVHDLGALAVASDAEFGGGALGEGLLDELYVGRGGGGG